MRALLLAAGLLMATPGAAQESPLAARADAAARAIEAKMIGWRRDIHANPELGDAEVRTAGLVAAHLKTLGLEVRTGVGRTGVVAVLRGGRPGPTVALRADMDALPVKEETGLPFASTKTGAYRGQTVPVMHACGHDAHTAILMAVAEVLAGMRAELPGTLLFLFQPAEEGSSVVEAGSGRSWGAKLMVEEGALNPKPDAVFGLHVFAGQPSGQIAWRPGPAMAAADNLQFTITGRQTHGALPWRGVDPIVVSAQLITSLQTVISRQSDLTNQPAVVTIGQIHGGNRFNIIPDSVFMEGTIRTYDPGMRDAIHGNIRRMADGITAASGAKADTKIITLYGVTSNDPPLAQRMEPTLRRIGGDNVNPNAPLQTGSEDVNEFMRDAPGLFLFLGVTPPADVKTAAPNHSPRFTVDEAALVQGVRVLTALAVDRLAMN